MEGKLKSTVKSSIMKLRAVLDLIMLHIDCVLEIAEIFEDFSRDAPNLLTRNQLYFFMDIKKIE